MVVDQVTEYFAVGQGGERLFALAAGVGGEPVLEAVDYLDRYAGSAS